jgi:hypothetical protein
MGINIPEVERQKASKALNCDHQCPLWVKSGHVHRKSRCPLCAINVRFASRRTATKFASLFDEAGGGVRDMTEIDRTGEHA